MGDKRHMKPPQKHEVAEAIDPFAGTDLPASSDEISTTSGDTSSSAPGTGSIAGAVPGSLTGDDVVVAGDISVRDVVEPLGSMASSDVQSARDTVTPTSDSAPAFATQSDAVSKDTPRTEVLGGPVLATQSDAVSKDTPRTEVLGGPVLATQSDAVSKDTPRTEVLDRPVLAGTDQTSSQDIQPREVLARDSILASTDTPSASDVITPTHAAAPAFAKQSDASAQDTSGREVIAGPILAGTDQASSPDVAGVEAVAPGVVAGTDLQSAGDTSTSIARRGDEFAGTDVASSKDVAAIEAVSNDVVAGGDIASSRDTVTPVSGEPPVLSTAELTPSKDSVPRQVLTGPVLASPEIQVATREGNVYEKFNDDFSGAWLPKGDPVRIGSNNYDTVENFRFTDFGLEGVNGYSKINAAAPYDGTSVLSLTNGIQLKSNFDRTSYVLVQAKNTNDDRYILQNTGTIATARNFDWFYIQTNVNDKLIMTSDLGGPATIVLAQNPYTAAALATQIAAQMNAGSGPGLTLNGGVITFGVTYDAATGYFTIDATAGHTIEFTYTGSTAGDTIGFTALKGGALTITSDTEVYGAATYLATETAGADVARFSLLPNGHVGICDGKKNYIWGGEESNIGAFFEDPAGKTTEIFLTDDALIDHTDTLSDIDSTRTVTIAVSTSKTYLLGSNRKLNGFYVRLAQANSVGGSTMKVRRYNSTDFGTGGTPFTDLSITDGTSDGTDTLAQDGWVTWPTYATEYPCLIEDRYLYYYQIYVDTGISVNTKIYNITTRSGLLPLGDIWDGDLRIPRLFMLHDDAGVDEKDKEYTLEVAERSYGGTLSITADWTNPRTADYLYVVFNEPMVGIYIELKVHNYDTNGNIEIGDWSGTAFSADYLSRDTTQKSYNSKSLSNDGYLFFNKSAPTITRTTLKGVTGYAYKVDFSANVTADFEIDYCAGIPLFRSTVEHRYTFPFMYKNRAMWCSSIYDKERNRVDYSAYGSPDVYNGADSSGRHNEQSLFFGGNEALTSAVELFNQYGDSIESVALFFKNTETYMLVGDSPANFRILRISGSIGCPAPLSAISAEVAFKSENSPNQNIAIWLSDKGPMMFVGNTILSVPGLENYFNPNHGDYVATSYATAITEARAWYDHNYKEYNLIVPQSAGGATILWFVYDFARQKWYTKKPTANHPFGAFPVEDSNGNKFNYGYTSTGYLLKMENGLYWSGTTKIENKIKTADMVLSDSLWLETCLRRISLVFEDNNEGVFTIKYYSDGDTITVQGIVLSAGSSYGCTATNISNAAGAFAADAAYWGSALTYQSSTVAWANSTLYRAMPAEILMAEANNKRYYHYLYDVSYDAYSHSLEFIFNSCTAKPPRLFMWGVEFDDVGKSL